MSTPTVTVPILWASGYAGEVVKQWTGASCVFMYSLTCTDQSQCPEFMGTRWPYLQITQGREMYKKVPYTSDLNHGDKYGTQWCMLFNTTSVECSRTVKPPNKLLISASRSDPNGIKGWAQVPIYGPLNPRHTNLMPALSECYSPSKTPPVTKTMTHTDISTSMRTIHATQIQTIVATVTAQGSVLSAGEKAGISIGSILAALLFFALGVLGTLTFLFLRARPKKPAASQEAAANHQGGNG